MLRQIKSAVRRLSRRFSDPITNSEKDKQLRPMSPRKALRDTAYLDGLKAFAAFMVYIHHMSMRYYPKLGNWYGRDPDDFQLIRLPFLRNIYVSGQSMVGIFFVVSGFILTTKPLQLTRKRDHAGLYNTIASCMFRRWFRLWLPAFFSTFIPIIAIQMGLDLDTPAGADQHPRLPTFGLQVTDWLVEMLRFSSPFAYADRHEQVRMKYDWVIWTLPLEYWAGMSIWVVCMAVCQIPRYFTRLVILLLCTWLSIYHGAWHFFCFLSGMMISDFQIESKTFECTGLFFEIMTHKRRQMLYWAIFIFGLYIAGAPGAPEYDLWDLKVPGYQWLYSLIPRGFAEPYRFYLSLTGISLVFATNRLPALQHIFESKIAQGFSKCSFPFFLLHQTGHDLIVRNWLGGAITQTLRLDLNTTLGHNIWFFTMLLLSTPMIYVCSRLFQTYIDSNCTKFAKNLEVFLRQSASAASTQQVERIMPLDDTFELEKTSLRDLEELSRLQNYCFKPSSGCLGDASPTASLVRT